MLAKIEGLLFKLLLVLMVLVVYSVLAVSFSAAVVLIFIAATPIAIYNIFKTGELNDKNNN